MLRVSVHIYMFCFKFMNGLFLWTCLVKGFTYEKRLERCILTTNCSVVVFVVIVFSFSLLVLLPFIDFLPLLFSIALVLNKF